MHYEIVIAGAGGQGALFAGQLLAYAAMERGLQVTWYPSYGPAMRGGTANCTVVISDTTIASPISSHPDFALTLNQPSMDKFEPALRAGGTLMYNSSLTIRTARRTDIQAIPVPAAEIATELGHLRLSNMVLLGALLAQIEGLGLPDLESALDHHLPARHRDMLEKNKVALKYGYQTNIEAPALTFEI